MIQNWDEVSDDLLGNLFSGSGLVWFGGLVGGALGVILWARWRGFLEARLFDLAAPGLALGYAIGRVGCQLSGDGDYGEATDAAVGRWPTPTAPCRTTEEVHPTPVFETLAMGLIALVLWNLRDRFAPGRPVRASTWCWRALERLLVEFIRRNDAVVAGLTQPQLISLAMIALGAALLIRLRGGPPAAGRLRPAAPRRPPRRRTAPAPPRRRRRCPGGARRRGPRRPAPIADGRAREHGRAPGLPRGGATATAGATSTRQHQQAAQPLDGHRQRRGQQAQQRQPHARRARRRAAAAPAGSKATARERAVQRQQRRAADHGQRRRRDQVGVGHAERVAEQQLLEARRGVGRERQQAARGRTCR